MGFLEVIPGSFKQMQTFWQGQLLLGDGATANPKEKLFYTNNYTEPAG